MESLKDIDMGELGRHLFAKLLRSTASDGTYEDMLEHCQNKKVKYTDDSFPPNKKSLINDWNDDAEDIQEKVPEWSEFTWIRASEIEELNDDEGKLAVFQDDVTPSDIKQGLLGDCYFLSILSALAEVPDRITKLFITDRFSEDGLYAVVVKKNGETKEVVIDDYFPCQDGEPCFSKANGNELWVLILEKVWAKLHGSYERIEAGHAHNVMADLTGAPSFDIDIDDYGEDELWERLVVSENKNYMMAASAGATEASADQLEELGLVAAHSYGLMKAVLVTDGFGDQVKLVQLRNPWGDFEWNGDWGDDSDLWTDEIKKQCDYNDDTGLFYMAYSDVCHYFSRI